MKGKAAIATEPRGPFQIREYPILEVGSDDILVRMRMANISGWRAGFS